MTRTNDSPAPAIRCAYCGDTRTVTDRVDGEITCPECGYDAPASGWTAEAMAEVIYGPAPAPSGSGVREALEKLRTIANDAGWHAEYRRGLFDAITAVSVALASEASPRGEAVVKPLDWTLGRATSDDPESGHFGCWTGGWYQVTREKRGMWSVGTHHVWAPGKSSSGQWRNLGFFPSKVDAKAAAQADYEARILSALASDAPAPSGSGVRTGAEMIARHRFRLADDGNCAEVDSGGLAEEIDAALASLASDASPRGEPVGWTGPGSIDALKEGKYGTLYPKPPTPLATALYAHPAPATVDNDTVRRAARAYDRRRDEGADPWDAMVAAITAALAPANEALHPPPDRA